MATAVPLEPGKTDLIVILNASRTAYITNHVAIIAPGFSLGWGLNARETT